MEQYADLHDGDLDGPLVGIHCHWSTDRTTLMGSGWQAPESAFDACSGLSW